MKPGSCARKSDSDVHVFDFACRCPAFGCATAPGAAAPRGKLRPWPERPTFFDAWRGIGEGWDVHAIPPPSGVAPNQQSLAGRPIGEPGRAGRGLSPWLAARVGGTARLGRGTVLTPLRGGPDKCAFRSGRCGYYFAREGLGDLQYRVRTPSAQTGGGSIP